MIYLTPVENFTNEHITSDVAKIICKVGQGEACCRYLTMGADGWSCERHSSLSKLIDHRVILGEFRSKAINCGGRMSRGGSMKK